MSRTDVSQLSSYTVTNGDAQIYYNNPVNTDIPITLPTAATAKWNNYPIIYLVNASPQNASNHPWMTFNLAPGVTVRAANTSVWTSYFHVRAGYSGYILYTGNDHWVIQGVALDNTDGGGGA